MLCLNFRDSVYSSFSTMLKGLESSQKPLHEDSIAIRPGWLKSAARKIISIYLPTSVKEAGIHPVIKKISAVVFMTKKLLSRSFWQHRGPSSHFGTLLNLCRLCSRNGRQGDS